MIKPQQQTEAITILLYFIVVFVFLFVFFIFFFFIHNKYNNCLPLILLSIHSFICSFIYYIVVVVVVVVVLIMMIVFFLTFFFHFIIHQDVIQCNGCSHSFLTVTDSWVCDFYGSIVVVIIIVVVINTLQQLDWIQRFVGF